MDLVYDVHLELAGKGGEGDMFLQFPDLVDPPVGSPVDLYYIEILP